MSKFFVDTNILVYVYDTSEGPKHAAARAVVEELWNEGNGVVSAQVLQEFFVTVTRKVSQPVSIDVARDWVARYLSWQVVEADGQSVLRAIDLQSRFQTSFWDAMILQSALRAGASTLLSEDLNHGQRYDSLIVENPLR
jgi:predicted nucleic acid-binding protein